MKNTIKDLKAARDLLEPKGAFTKEVLARNKYRNSVPVQSNAACKFCAMGALYKVTGADAPWDFLNSPIVQALEVGMAGEIDVVDPIPYHNDLPMTKQIHVLMAYDFSILSSQDKLKELKKQIKDAK